MKKRLVVLLSLIFALIIACMSFVACGNGGGESGGQTTPGGDESGGNSGGEENGGNSGGESGGGWELVLPKPVANPENNDIFGRIPNGKHNYNDTDEFNGTAVLSSNGLTQSSTQGVKSVLYNWEDASKYQLNTALLPFWRSKNVYNETVTFKNKDDTPQLLYTPTKIISVYDYYLEKEYKEGDDFVIEGNRIKLTTDTKINYWTNFYSDTYYNNLHKSMITKDGKYIYAWEIEPNRHQISVSYEHNGEWTGAVPVNQSAAIPKTIEKLKKGQTIKIGITGDSITYGRGCSGDFGYGAKTPRYASLVDNYLRARFPSANIITENVGYGGKAAVWGAESVQRFTIIPDVCIVALGENDIITPTDTYRIYMQNTVNALRELNPDMEIIVVSPMTGNKELVGSTGTEGGYYGEKAKFEDELCKIAKAATGVIVAPVMSITKSLYDNGKRFEDVNSNNLNHPNDYIHRVYAQTILKTMLGDDFNAL